ncbi:MAG: hypothetical protein M3R63_01060 [Actinomycetota bacterium]|nr:hypothetical protein [Actinomycetota bacterium]
MFWFLAGIAIGYVLGAQAGRERYDQLMQTYQRVAGHPAVQSAAVKARAKATEVMDGR